MFEGIKRSYTLLILLLMEIIEELGTKKSIEMLQRAAEKQADIISQEIEGEISKNSSPLEKGVEVYSLFMEDAGAEVAIYEKNAVSVTFIVKRCPFFEAILDVGVDCGYFLGSLCTHLTLPAIQATLEKIDPRIKLESRLIKESSEEFCLERIYLERD